MKERTQDSRGWSDKGARPPDMWHPSELLFSPARVLGGQIVAARTYGQIAEPEQHRRHSVLQSTHAV